MMMFGFSGGLLSRLGGWLILGCGCARGLPLGIADESVVVVVLWLLEADGCCVVVVVVD